MTYANSRCWPKKNLGLSLANPIVQDGGLTIPLKNGPVRLGSNTGSDEQGSIAGSEELGLIPACCKQFSLSLD